MKGTSDLDCVLVLNDIEDVQDLQENIDEIKDDLEKCLTAVPSYVQQDWEIQIESITRFSVQFTMTKRLSSSQVVEVDLLPTFDIGKFGNCVFVGAMHDFLKRHDLCYNFELVHTDYSLRFYISHWIKMIMCVFQPDDDAGCIETLLVLS